MARPTVQLKCIVCSAEFERETRREKGRIKKKQSGPYCSKKCQCKAPRSAASTNKRGERNSRSVLTDKDVKLIRKRYRYGVPVKTLMILTGMSENALRCILTRKTWTHLPDDY